MRTKELMTPDFNLRLPRVPGIPFSFPSGITVHMRVVSGRVRTDTEHSRDPELKKE